MKIANFVKKTLQADLKNKSITEFEKSLTQSFKSKQKKEEQLSLLLQTTSKKLQKKLFESLSIEQIEEFFNRT